MNNLSSLIRLSSRQQRAGKNVAASRVCFSSQEYYRNDVVLTLEENESVRNSMAYSLAMANTAQPVDMLPPLNDRMREQLRICRNQLLNNNVTSNISDYVRTIDDDQPQLFSIDLLPTTLEEAVCDNKKQAFVVTETSKPFKVVNVNQAWEDLCEYTHVESCGRSLGGLIQGPETDKMTITALMVKLLEGEIATAILTNYKKSGHSFQNRLSVGPIYDSSNPGQITHFVGMLQEV